MIAILRSRFWIGKDLVPHVALTSTPETIRKLASQWIAISGLKFWTLTTSVKHAAIILTHQLMELSVRVTAATQPLKLWQKQENAWLAKNTLSQTRMIPWTENVSLNHALMTRHSRGMEDVSSSHSSLNKTSPVKMRLGHNWESKEILQTCKL